MQKEALQIQVTTSPHALQEAPAFVCFRLKSLVFLGLFFREGREYRLGNQQTWAEAQRHRHQQSPLDMSLNIPEAPFPQPQSGINKMPALCRKVLRKRKPRTNVFCLSLSGTASLDHSSWPVFRPLLILQLLALNCPYSSVFLPFSLSFPLLPFYVLALILLRSGQELGGSFKEGGPELKTPGMGSVSSQSTCTVLDSAPTFEPVTWTPQGRQPHEVSLPSLLGLPAILAQSFHDLVLMRISQAPALCKAWCCSDEM